MTTNDLPWHEEDAVDAVVLEEARETAEAIVLGEENANVHIEHLDQPHGDILSESDVLADLYQSQRWVPSERRSRIAYPARMS
jgi:hypothetical protein